ncbi:sulfurtransferase complex subunit TusD [Blochmannia endosymbiont of Colobopsis nipponica]|uniref:sulfurtransferase complex subunit TusD n=1 Tax=Blochmannia endosymbiont of Colobopsis nipponica TaxID=2681987 RepID=UPI0017805E6B|nr:sulfurtransferase complex subunit TusD [Blochmannia endosymbiont of Colobopsis nipponica]QOI10906.1 sulfurtransferase complex subunit TusD [Blochmannia endosymbiont of Colobopsis nipponica]
MVSLSYVLFVNVSAYGKQVAIVSLQFARALLKYNHRLVMVFFYQDGVSNANSLILNDDDEINLVNLWQDFSNIHSVELHVCIAAALRRGLVDRDRVTAFHFSDSNLQKAFKLSSLGALIQAMVNCDRFIQF